MAEELPLFVLPMILLPNEVQQLRIFEPRYKQMLDDCLLDGKNFGLVMNDEFSNVNGWDGPRDYGCEAEIIHHETKGSNHFIEIIGRRRFSVKKVIDPALPPFSDESMSDLISVEGIFPDLETIIDKIPQDSSNSKLYISAEVEYLEETENISENKL
ncbi:MAG: LON peptidase substrate-binding domain-containing protein, partial [Candidatus Poseidoniaceae archaeon]